MTGGQMAPTTLDHMKTSTSPEGRDVHTTGNPLKILDLLALLDGVCLATRQSVHTAAAVRKAKNKIRLHLKIQCRNKDYPLSNRIDM
jgi:2-oxoglutarate ferredoxin oxidoreductase subunit beta